MAKSKNLTTALSYLITSQPFIAVLLMDLLEIVEVKDPPGVPCAATDNKRIILNTSWTGNLQVQELAFVIAHEVLHVIYNHLPVSHTYADRGIGPDFKPYSHNRMNKAQDFVINGTLVESKIGKMPIEGLHNPHIGSADQADDVYCRLPEEKDPPSGGGQGNGGRGGGFDKHQKPQSKPSKGQVQRAVAAATAAAKAQGNLPAGLARLAGEILDPKQDWRELLRDFMVTAMGHDETTWKRLNRRKLAVAPHVAFPGTQGYKAGRVAVVIDTSGSISQEELTAFMGELNGIRQDATPEELKVFWTDAQVAGIDTIDEYDDLTQLEPKGGGGTDMEAAFPVVFKEFTGGADCCVVLTDGYTSFNEGNDPGFPVMWCITSKDVVAPYGQSVHLTV